MDHPGVIVLSGMMQHPDIDAENLL
jgi:hypothetical protein